MESERRINASYIGYDFDPRVNANPERAGFFPFGPHNAGGAMGLFDVFGPRDGRRQVSALEQSTMLVKRAQRVPVEFGAPRAPTVEIPRTTEGEVAVRENYIYRGQLLDGVPEGNGTLYCVSSKEVVYQGCFHEGLYNGYGVLFFENAECARGTFENGRLVHGRRILKDGSILNGGIEGNRLKGEGRLIFPSGVCIEGNWVEGKPKGMVKCRMPGYEEVIDYDYDNRDDNTRIRVEVYDEVVFFRDNTLVKTGMNPEFLFYRNGDIFVGATKRGKEPSKGLFFHFTKDHYTQMVMNGGCEDLSIKDISYVDEGLVKSIRFEM